MTRDRSLRYLANLQHLTEARIGLPRAGSSLSTQEVLRFDLDHARARDAVHLSFDAEAMVRGVRERELDCLSVHSIVKDRTEYLQRPDRGRRLNQQSHENLAAAGGKFDMALVIADGLSTRGVHENALPFLDVLLPYARDKSWALAPVVVATQARVALGDEIGQLLGARLVAMLIGERPGLTSADSMGIYLTYGPRIGRTDAERNCISNVRKGGLNHDRAAQLLVHLATRALQLQLTGVQLKDDSRILDAPDLQAGDPRLPDS
jgi:ethanolamine ammonia-lyase small subunit